MTEKLVVYNVRIKDRAKIDKFMAKLNYKPLPEKRFIYYATTSY